jgi:hypothetical protein
LLHPFRRDHEVPMSGFGGVMLPTKDLLDHIDALLSLSHDAGDRVMSAKLRQMADEFRIMVSVADISNLAATLSKNTAAAAPIAPASDVVGSEAGAKKAPALARDEAAVGMSRVFQARYAGSNGTFACSRVGAP